MTASENETPMDTSNAGKTKVREPDKNGKEGDASRQEKRKENSSAQGKRTIIILAAVSIVLMLAVILLWWRGAFTTEKKYPALPTPPLEISVDKAQQSLSIGVVTSYTEDPAQGRGWDLNGGGVTVAKWRLQQGGTNVRIEVVSDQGSANQSAAAVQKLANADVSGIIALTTGTHTDALAQAASRAGIPVIFPYQPRPEKPLPLTWYGEPSVAEIQDELRTAATTRNCTTLYGVGKQNSLAEIADFMIDYPQAKVGNPQVLRSLKSKSDACLVVDLAPKQAAELVVYLRSNGANMPIFMGPQVLNSQFGQTLMSAGVAPGVLFTVGVPTVNSMRTAAGGTGGVEAGLFTQAVQLMATDAGIKTLDGSEAFAKQSAWADASSHDALLAFVYAAARAQSTAPDKVENALVTTPVTSNEGTLEPELSFVDNAPYVKTTLIESVVIDGAVAWAALK